MFIGLRHLKNGGDHSYTFPNKPHKIFIPDEIKSSQLYDLCQLAAKALSIFITWITNQGHPDNFWRLGERQPGEYNNNKTPRRRSPGPHVPDYWEFMQQGHIIISKMVALYSNFPVSKRLGNSQKLGIFTFWTKNIRRSGTQNDIKTRWYFQMGKKSCK